MWIKSSGPLTENVYQLTTAVSTHFLIGGECAALIDSGVSATHERLVSELKKYLGDSSELKYVFLTHAHFDHIGGVPFLRQYAPHMQLLASPLTAQLLSDAALLQHFYRRNAEVAAAMQVPFEISEGDWAQALKVDHVLGDGDVIDLGADVDIKLIGCPGHTEDVVAYYVRSDAALSAAEAVGSYDGRDKLYPCFPWSYHNYVISLDRLAGLEVKVLGLPHAGALTGELPSKYLVEARVAADRFAASVRERIEQGELIDEIFSAQLLEWSSQNICPEGPFVEEQAETLREMIRVVAENK
jgi:glyoxylase-like metal-dependent hydrolase (beta-lactamase superfamily II)